MISQSVVPLEITENHPLLSSVQDLTWTEHDVDYINWLDGDSFKTTYNGERCECRVFGIDSPELDSVILKILCEEKFLFRWACAIILLCNNKPLWRTAFSLLVVRIVPTNFEAKKLPNNETSRI